MRYKIMEGSDSGHCCFQYSIIDTHNTTDDCIAETFEQHEAELICKSLNALKDGFASFEYIQNEVKETPTNPNYQRYIEVG